MSNRFKTPELRKMYDTLLRMARDDYSSLYINHRPRRGASHRVYFWDGYLGKVMRSDNTLGYAAHRAGQDFRKETDQYVSSAGYQIRFKDRNEA